MEQDQVIRGLESAARLMRAGHTLDKEHKDALAQALGLTREDPTFRAPEFWKRAKEMANPTMSVEVAFGWLAEAHVEDMQMRISHEQERARELVRRAQEAEGKLHSLRGRYEELAREMTLAIQQRKDAVAAVTMAHASLDAVWLWQGDDTDKPESLVCPVVMSAETLRGMVAKMESAKGLEETRDDALGRLKARNEEVDRLKADREELRASVGNLEYQVKNLRASRNEEQQSTLALRALCAAMESALLIPELRSNLSSKARGTGENDEPMVLLSVTESGAQKLLDVLTSPLPKTPLSEAMEPFLRLAKTVPTKTTNEFPVAGLLVGPWLGSEEPVRLTVGDLRQLQQVVG